MLHISASQRSAARGGLNIRKTGYFKVGYTVWIINDRSSALLNSDLPGVKVSSNFVDI